MSLKKLSVGMVDLEVAESKNKGVLTLDDKLVYTVKEVAGIIHTNTTYVYQLINAGLLPAMKLGSYKIRKEALMNFLQQSEGKDLTNPYHVTSL